MKEKESVSIRTRAFRLLALLAACALLALSAGFAWSVVDDFVSREIVPTGVSVSGHDLSGLTREQAREVIANTVVAPYFEPVLLSFNDREFEFDPELSLAIDADAMLETAFGPKTSTTVAERSYRRLTGEPVPVEIAPELSVEGASLESWIDEIAAKVDAPSVDATVTLINDEVVIQKSAVGYETDREATLEALTAALLAGTKQVTLPVTEIEPSMAEDELGTWIRVDLSERHAYLYHGAEIYKDYGIAIGTPGHSTPRGAYEITLKRYMPTWRNPGSAWAADMPDSIGPGVSNPLGTRAINISASGIRFHGTTQDWSIGRAASHGCMRMHRWDVEDLYEEVEVGNKVFIVS